MYGPSNTRNQLLRPYGRVTQIFHFYIFNLIICEKVGKIADRAFASHCDEVFSNLNAFSIFMVLL